MPTVTVAQNITVGGAPVAHLVTQDGTAVSLGYTPTGGDITPGGPVFTQVDRQGRDPLIRAEKRRATQMRFSHMVGGADGKPVDAALKAMAKLVDAGDPVRLIGVSGLETAGWWLIDDMTISVLRRTPTQQVMRAQVTWQLVPYTPQATVDAKTAGKTAAAPAAAKPAAATSHTVVKGDTLWGIALKYLGSGARYPEIASLNGVKNPNLIYPGQVFKIPAR